MSRTISNTEIRERFAKLADGHGGAALAEHIGLELGWDTDGHGRRQLVHQYRRGVLVQLGLMPNRNTETIETIPAARARQIHEVLDRVDAGGPLQREDIVVSKPSHVTPGRAVA